MIELRNVTKRFDSLVVLDDVSVSFDKGLIGIKGVSGEGKSTLLNLISSLDSSYDGDIFFDGVNYKSIDDKERFRYQNFGFVFQNPILFNLLSVFDNICYDEEKTYINKQKVSDILSKIGLNVNLDEGVNHLSGGEKQRISIARSLFHNARVILCDEPTGALDLKTSENIMSLLKEVSKTRLVIVVSHQNDLLKKYADKIYCLKDRKINLEYELSNSLSVVESRGNTRNNLSLKVIFSYILKNIKIKKVRSIISFFTIGLGLFSIGISSLITSVVSLNVQNSLMSEFDENKFFVKNKNSNNNGFNEIYALSKEEVESVKDRCEDVSYVGSFYFSSFEEQMVDRNYFEMSIGNFISIFSELNIRSINEYQVLSENEVVYPSYPDNLGDDEIVLSLRKKDIKRICQNLDLVENSEIALSNYLVNNYIDFSYIGENISWEYDVKVDFRCRYFVVSNDIGIYHFNRFWNEYVFENKMKLSASNDLLAYSYLPWTIKKVFYLKVDEYNQIDVLKKLICDKRFNDFYFDFIDKNNCKSLCKNGEKSGRIYVTNQTNSRFDMGSIISNDVSVFGNNSTYYIYEKMLLNGFVKPTFLVKNEHKLISLIDEFSFTDDDLLSMNYIDENVCFGSLASIMEKSNLKFKNIDEVDELIGRESFSYQEIVISKGVAKTLFGDLLISDILHQTLYFLTLSDSYVEKEIYHNNFSYIKLKIVGVVDVDENIVYGDELWTSLFYVDNFSFSLSDNLPINCVVRNKNVSDSFVFVDPFLEVINDMNNLLYYVKLGLSVFSVMCIVSAILMNVVIMYLYIEDCRKEIALMIALGISKRSILILFTLFSIVIGFISFLYSVFCLVVTSLVLSFEFGSLSYFSFDLFFETSFIIFLIMIFVSLVIGVISSKNVLDRKVLISLKEK